MSKLPWFSFYPADFLTDSAVMRMNNQQKGIYIMLLSTAWLEGGIPADLAQVAAMVHESEQSLSSAWPLLAEKWLPDPSDPRRLINPRMEFERMKQQQIAAAKANAGALGGKSRAQKAVSLRSNAQAVLDSASSKPQANSSQSQSQSQLTTTSPTPPSEGSTAPKVSTRKGKTLCPDPFEITDGLREFLRGLYPGIGQNTVQREHDKFMDWTRSNRIMKADWTATWKNWFRNAYQKSVEFRQAVDAARNRPPTKEGEHGPFSNRA